MKVNDMKTGFNKIKAFLLLFLFCLSLSLPSSGYSARYSEAFAECETDTDSVECIGGVGEDVKVSSRLFELFFGKGEDMERIKLCPGGSVFGLLIDEGAVSVASSNSRVLLSGDKIIKVNKIPVSTPSEVEEIVASSGGKCLEIELMRSGHKMCVSIIPRLEGGEYKLGVTLRARTAGIGTVTFIDPETRAFGGLGHGVSEGEGRGYVSVKSGTVNDVVLGGCKRGEVGRAGELTGILKQNSHGSILSNNECGVFGVLDDMPDYAGAAIPIAFRDEVKAGEAEIISTVKNGLRRTYKIEIYDIDRTSEGSKSFKIRVTDPTLISITGGIVRGMSGSPIIQDGKLVGAVTHVMVANPTEGYGIFIENMLSAAQNQVIPKAA